MKLFTFTISPSCCLPVILGYVEDNLALSLLSRSRGLLFLSTSSFLILHDPNLPWLSVYFEVGQIDDQRLAVVFKSTDLILHLSIFFYHTANLLQVEAL